MIIGADKSAIEYKGELVESAVAIADEVLTQLAQKVMAKQRGSND